MTTKTITKTTVLFLLSIATISCGKIREDIDPDTQDFLDINDYLFSRNIEATAHPSGVYFVLNERGNGLSPIPTDSVVVDYSIYYLDGRLIDTTKEGIARENDLYDPNHPYRPFIFALGRGQIIRGFEIGQKYYQRMVQGRSTYLQDLDSQVGGQH